MVWQGRVGQVDQKYARAGHRNSIKHINFIGLVIIKHNRHGAKQIAVKEQANLTIEPHFSAKLFIRVKYFL